MRELPYSRHRFTFVLGAAFAVAAMLVAGNQISARASDETKPKVTASGAQRGAAERHPASLFAGIPQRGAVLGPRTAPVTLVEYADLQCPYCAEWARATLPVLVDRYVREGKLRVVFNGMAFIGPDSDKALRVAVAAGRHNHLWDVVDALYENQGVENSGWVTNDLVKKLVAGIPGVNGASLLHDRRQLSVGHAIERAAATARAAGVSGTPTFQVGPTGGRLQFVQLSSLGPDGIVPSIEAVSAR